MKLELTLVGIVTCVLFIDQSTSLHDDSAHNGPIPHLIGGDVVRPLDRPFAVSLRLSVDKELIRFCGGARLGDEWIITAAECLDRSKYNHVQIRYMYAKGYDEKGWFLKNLDYKIHPDYDKETKANNIALIYCGACYDAVKLRSARLPYRDDINQTYAELPAVISGYQSTYDSNKKEYYYITSTETTILRQLWCKLLYLFRSIRDNHICASGTRGRALSQNDVGVPLVVRWGPVDPFFKIIGIGSSIQPWTRLFSLPMVFTRLSLYVEWIQSVTKLTSFD